MGYPAVITSPLSSLSLGSSPTTTFTMTDSHSNPASDSNPSPTPSNPVASTGIEDEPPVRKGTSKKFHKRSRTGCQKCRARRIKCDETKPVCRNCQRHDALACVYDRQNEDSSPKENSAAASTPNFNKIPAKPVEAGESRNRRKLELDLLHFYITETGPNTSFDPMPSRNGEHTSYELWVKAMPRMAFKSEAMLYSMHAVTCLHKTRTTGGSSPGIPAPSVVAAFKEHHQYYLEKALNCHREDLMTLTNAGDQSGDSADILLLTASLLRVIVLVTFSKRSLSPYTPPIEWMRLTSSYRQVWSIAWNLNGDSDSSQVTQLALTTARFPPYDESDDSDDIRRLWDLLQEPGSRDGFLDEEGNPSEWWPNVRSGYEATIRHIGGIIQAMKRREPLRIVGRHLVRYPMYADSNFINMVGDGRPRALVLVAHLFALFEQLKQFWYIETLAQREVRAIASILPPHWQPYMQWPLQIVDYGFPPEYMATP